MKTPETNTKPATMSTHADTIMKLGLLLPVLGFILGLGIDLSVREGGATVLFLLVSIPVGGVLVAGAVVLKIGAALFHKDK